MKNLYYVIIIFCLLCYSSLEGQSIKRTTQWINQSLDKMLIHNNITTVRYYSNVYKIESRKYLRVYSDTKSKLICAMMPIKDVVIDTLTFQNMFFITFRLRSGRLIARAIQEKDNEGVTSTAADTKIFALLFPKTILTTEQGGRMIKAFNHLVRRYGGRKKNKNYFK